MDNIYLFKVINNNYRAKYESQFFIKKIIKTEINNIDINIIYDDILWKYIEMFQKNTLFSKQLIKHAFLILFENHFCHNLH